METIERRGWLYRLERDKKGRIIKMVSLGPLEPQLLLNLTELVDGHPLASERVLLEAVQKWLREYVPRIKRDGMFFYQVGRVPKQQKPNKTDGNGGDD